MNREEQTFKNHTPQTGQSLPVPNRTYKDTLFRMVFREKENLLPLYNALNGTDYTNEEELQVVTLENAIYMNMKNDVAFILGDLLSLYEHQSTYNPNMPLRDLFYISREYEALINQNALYLSTKVQIPNPRFVVFYNGTEKQPETKIMKLSDLYQKPETSPELELSVRMLNINSGCHKKLLSQCQALSEYMQYVTTVRHYATRMPIAEAVELAVTECIRQGILAAFLSKYQKEAISVSIFEYDEEQTMRLIKQDEYRLGKEEGILLGEERGKEQGILLGKEQSILQSLCSLMDTLKLNAIQAMDALGIPEEKRAFYTARMQKNLQQASAKD